MDRPYGLGYNGHARSCPCEACAKAHAAKVEELWEANGKFAKPRSADETVFVRSYFRRQPNHFAKRPEFRKAMRALISSIRRNED